MATIAVSDLPLEADGPAQRLRRVAAAVRVHFCWWGVHRTLTAQQKEEVGLAYDADGRFITAGKKLVDVRHEAFRQLTSLRTRVIHYWRGLTLPYVEPGVRLIRQADVEPFVHAMQTFRQDLVHAEAEVNAAYDEIKADARGRLGRLYNAADYPPEVRGLFDVDWDFPSVEPPPYLLRLNPELYRQEQERIARRFEEAVQLAEQAFVSEFAKLVAHLSERLSGADGERRIFRDSAVGNLHAFFERFRTLNVRSNDQLDELVAQVQRVVSGIDPQDLRAQDGLRQQVAAQLAQVQTELDDLLVEQPRRRLVRNHPSNSGANHATAD